MSWDRFDIFAVPAPEFHLMHRDFVQEPGGLFIVLAEKSQPPADSPADQLSDGQPRGWSPDFPQETGVWLHIGQDEHAASAVTLFTGKAEVGQDVRTSMAQIVAEELRVQASEVRVVLGDTGLTPYDVGTFGSRSTPITGVHCRFAAIAAREMLLDLASVQAQCERQVLVASQGRVRHKATGRSFGFGELARDITTARRIECQAAVTPAQNWSVAGQSAPRASARDMATGEHRYASDLRRPEMLWGKVLRPPSFGARLQVLDDSAARAMSGVIVARDGAFIGVAAEHPDTAERALASLQATWTQPDHAPGSDTSEYFRNNTDAVQGARNSEPHIVGSVAEGLRQADHVIEARYHIAFIAHAPLEPRAALAEWEAQREGDRLTVWTGTQRPFGVREELARAFEMPEASIRVIVPDTGSGYGGKHTGEAAIEAARLARVAGRPVKLVWTREEEFTWAYFRPGGLIEAKVGFQSDGTLMAWEFHNLNSGSSGIRTPYNVAHQHIEFHEVESPLRQGSYRALAATANHLARECLMDEIAHRLGCEPLEFRLRNLRDERLRAVLQAAAERFGWGARPEVGRGFGLAVGTEKGGYVATCAQVCVRGGEIKVERLVTAFECGAIINPDGLRNQVEGSVVQGMGGALFEAIRWSQGRIESNCFSRYRVPRFSDMPTLETVLLDRRDLPSAGAGEAPIITAAPAIGNAIFAASGVRLRSLPMALEAVPSK